MTPQEELRRAEELCVRFELHIKYATGLREGQQILVPVTREEVRDYRKIIETLKAERIVSLRLERELHDAIKRLEARR